MAIQLIWEEKYSVKHQGIDEQHKQIFRVVNDLPEVLEKSKLKEIAELMKVHAQKHFADEELLMRDMKYPQLEEHQKLHEKILSGVTRPISHPSDFKDDQAVISFKLTMIQTVIEHIGIHDMAAMHPAT